MAEVIQIRPEDYRDETAQEAPGAAPALGTLGQAPAPANPASPAQAGLLEQIPRWVWIAGGAVLFLGLVYVLQRQFVATPRRPRAARPKRRRGNAAGLAAARRARMEQELEDYETD